MTAKTALLVVDMQNDFFPGGPLGVAGADEILQTVNDLIASHDHVVMTQDWHPAGHSSFASSHPGKQPFETIETAYGPQTLWPDHCIIGSEGAAIHPDLDWVKAELVIRKGYRPELDSFSAFLENDKQTPTGLFGYLKERGLERLVVCGLATDYCAGFSAIDAARLGLDVTLMLDATRAISDETRAHALKAFGEAGVKLG